MPPKVETAIAKVFWSGRSQAIRLPKQFRFATDTVIVRKEGLAVIIEPSDEWPANYIESFAHLGEDFQRPPQGESDEREDMP